MGGPPIKAQFPHPPGPTSWTLPIPSPAPDPTAHRSFPHPGILKKSAKKSACTRCGNRGNHPPGRENLDRPPQCCRGVAQSGSAPRSGRGGRGFESRRPDHREILTLKSNSNPTGLLPPRAGRRDENPCAAWVRTQVRASRASHPTAKRKLAWPTAIPPPRPLSGSCSISNSESTSYEDPERSSTEIPERIPVNLTRRPGPMIRKRKRRSSVVEIGTGPCRVKIYTVNRKDGYPMYSLYWNRGRDFRRGTP